MHFNLLEIPFSRFGSYLAISAFREDGIERLYIRDISNGNKDRGKIFKLTFYRDDEEITDYTYDVCETKLSIFCGDDIIQILYSTEDTIKIVGSGIVLGLSHPVRKYDNIYSAEIDKWILCSYYKEMKLMIEKLQGEVEIIAPWERIGNTSIDLRIYGEKGFDISLQRYKVIPEISKRRYDDLNIIEGNLISEYESWRKKIPDISSCKVGLDLASYITWCNFVRPQGHITRYAMYMTKNYMTNIWSWDNCFGAICLANKDKDLALNQLLIFRDNQDDSGMTPDYINDTEVSYSCAKPPIYGWCYDYMIKRNEEFDNQENILKVYELIKNQTMFWMSHRMSQYGLPYYIHGNESGWDNSSLYNRGIPVIAPDLSSFIIYQMDTLAKMANRLERRKEAEYWQEKAEDLYRKMMEFLYVDGEFKAYSLAVDHYIEDGDSLQLMLPLIIHYRLDKSVKDLLCEAVLDKERFWSEYGLATESMKSKFYEKDGYWRGPIWAPVMLMFIDILNDMGDIQVSRMLAKGFIQCVNKWGLAENFDPITGEGYGDTGFAWTAAVYITIVEDYLLNNE